MKILKIDKKSNRNLKFLTEAYCSLACITKYSFHLALRLLKWRRYTISHPLNILDFLQ